MSIYDYKLVPYYNYVIGEPPYRKNIDSALLKFFEKEEELKANDLPLFETYASQRIEIVKDLFTADMIVKMAAPDGQVPFLTDPTDYPVLKSFVRRFNQPRSVIVRHFEFLAHTNLITFHNAESIKQTFFIGYEPLDEYVPQPEEFGVLSPLSREIMFQMDRMLRVGMIAKICKELHVFVPKILQNDYH